MSQLSLCLSLAFSVIAFSSHDSARGQQGPADEADVDRENAFAAIAPKLRRQGVLLAQTGREFVRVLPKWKGHLDTLRRMSELRPTGYFCAHHNVLFNDDVVQIVFSKSRFGRVWISDCPVTDVSLPWIAKSKTITELEFSSCDITDGGLPIIETMTQLKLLKLRKTKVTAAGLNALQKALPNCEIRADVIPSYNGSLTNELHHAVFSLVLSKAKDKQEYRRLWKEARLPGGEVPRLVDEEVRRMRRLDPQFLKVMPERAALFHSKADPPPDMKQRIERGLSVVKDNDDQLTETAELLIKRYKRGRHDLLTLELLAQYMDAIAKKHR